MYAMGLSSQVKCPEKKERSEKITTMDLREADLKG